MTDISIVGVGGLLGALATIALGMVALLVASVVAVGERRRQLGRRLVEYGAGPLACMAVGIVSTALVLRASATEADRFFLVTPVVGIVVGVFVAATLRVNRATKRSSL